MKKIAQGIVRLRKLILTVAFLLLIPSAIGAIATRINYDILTYLPQDLDSMIGEVTLEDDFHLASTGMITVEGLPTNELIAMKKEIDAVPGVTQTFWLSDVIDPNIPTAMLPADVQQFMFGKNDSTMLIVRFDAPSASDETMDAVAQIEKLLRKDCFFGGLSVILQDTKALVNQEMPMYILIAVGASLLVLFLSLESTLTPLLFMLGLLFPIAYNFGTNIFLGQISYITEALATVLQLGVTMDFSIFLLHRYEEEKELRSSNEEAMTSAICKTMTSISASSLTTIAGFLALCAMRLTLGRDIGLVMAKGVALGVICTVVILPSLILTFDKWVEKYKHRTVIPKLTKLSYFVSKHSVPIVVVFILILIPFAIAQNKTSVYYTLFDSLPQDLTGIVGTNKLGEDFGMTTSHFILVHDDLTATEVSDLCDELKDVDGITQVVSLDSITGPGFQTELLPDSIMEILQSGGYKLILANSSYKTGTNAICNQRRHPFFQNTILQNRLQNIIFYLTVNFMLTAGHGQDDLCSPFHSLCQCIIRCRITCMKRNNHIHGGHPFIIRNIALIKFQFFIAVFYGQLTAFFDYICFQIQSDDRNIVPLQFTQIIIHGKCQIRFAASEIQYGNLPLS